jgi:hypothetical protein
MSFKLGLEVCLKMCLTLGLKKGPALGLKLCFTLGLKGCLSLTFAIDLAQQVINLAEKVVKGRGLWALRIRTSNAVGVTGS